MEISLERAFLISIWLEAIFYGFFFCVFCVSVYVNMSERKEQDRHSFVMFGISCTMYLLATIHIAVNCYRLVEAYVVYGTRDGPNIFLNDLTHWSSIMKDTIYATQEILGDAAAIYRCFFLWDKDWRIVALPLLILLGSIVTGYTTCATFTKLDPNQPVFISQLFSLITSFYVLAIVQTAITTSLMAYRIWKTERLNSEVRSRNKPGSSDAGNLQSILFIVVESAAIQFLAEALVLGLYVSKSNAQYILLECVCPIAGITFIAISLRIRLRRQQNLTTRPAHHHTFAARRGDVTFETNDDSNLNACGTYHINVSPSATDTNTDIRSQTGDFGTKGYQVEDDTMNKLATE